MVGGDNNSKNLGSFQRCSGEAFLTGTNSESVEILVGLKQEGLVREFREQFEMYSWPLKISEHRYLLGLFLNGSKDEIRAKLKLRTFHTLD